MWENLSQNTQLVEDKKGFQPVLPRPLHDLSMLCLHFSGDFIQSGGRQNQEQTELFTLLLPYHKAKEPGGTGNATAPPLILPVRKTRNPERGGGPAQSPSK